MSILAANIYHHDVLARIYRVLFLDAETETGWANLVAIRNADYARYLTPPETAAGTAQWDWSIRAGQMANTIDRLNDKWSGIIQEYVATSVSAGAARRMAEKGGR